MSRLSAVLALASLAILTGCAGSLQTAIKHEDIAGIESALASEDINKSFFSPNIEPACYACDNGKFDSLKYLVSKGARLNGRFFVDSPLFYCAYNGRLDMAKYLVEHGALIGEREMTAARWVAKKHPEVLAYFEAEKPRQLERLKNGAPRQPGNLDPDAMKRMLESSRAQAAKAIFSDVDEPTRSGADRPDDFALVIGIEDYQSLPKADFGARDAQAVRKHLEALGVPARNIVSLEGQTATKSKLQSYIEEWLPLNVKEDSTLFVYYSGHGAPDPKTGDAYLVPWDGDPKFLKTSSYSLKQLYANLAKIKAKNIVVVLDACFSGAGGRSVLAKGARPLVTKVEQDLPASNNLTVLAAASGDEITGTLDDQGHGLFTYYFLKGLDQGKTGSRELFDFLKPKVEDEARRQNREQTPTFAGADQRF